PSVRVQCGGGVRSRAAARALVDAGVDRVVVGTAAMENPDLVGEIATECEVAVGLDVRGSEVAIHGWTRGSGADIADVAMGFESVGASAWVVTQILQDGTLEGPDMAGLQALLSSTSLPLIASGGVGSLAHLEALAMLNAGERRLAGVIVGKALY